MRPALAALAVSLGVLAACAAPPDPGYGVELTTTPPIMQSNRSGTVTLRITDSGGEPLTGAKVSVKPEHTGHSMPIGTFATDEFEPGVYSAEFLPPMSGIYLFTVTVEASGGTTTRMFDARIR